MRGVGKARVSGEGKDEKDPKKRYGRRKGREGRKAIAKGKKRQGTTKRHASHLVLHYHLPSLPSFIIAPSIEPRPMQSHHPPAQHSCPSPPCSTIRRMRSRSRGRSRHGNKEDKKEEEEEEEEELS